MWYVGINDESPKDVKFKFSDAREHLLDVGLEIDNYNVVDLVYKFENIINKFIEINPKFKDKVDTYEDYSYYISCETEEQAMQLEEQLEEQCEKVWEEIEEELEEYYEECEE